LIVVDASVLISIADGEDDAAILLARLNSASARVMAAINYVEVGMVLLNRRRELTQADIDAWMRRLDIRVVDGESLAPVALSAHLRFGKGRHPAKLDLADCFAYALSKRLDAPLLFKGEDFPLTDISRALQPT
jgi:ribonuclease VapC